jgi:hypothetical protein
MAGPIDDGSDVRLDDAVCRGASPDEGTRPPGARRQSAIGDRPRTRVVVVLIVVAGALAAVVASAIDSAEPVHRMPNGSTMDGGQMPR